MKYVQDLRTLVHDYFEPLVQLATVNMRGWLESSSMHTNVQHGRRAHAVLLLDLHFIGGTRENCISRDVMKNKM